MIVRHYPAHPYTLMFGTSFKTGATKAFGHFGGAVRRFGTIGHAAIRTAGHVANAVAGAYNTIDDITGGALDKTLRTVPGVGTALTAGGVGLNFYNRHIDPRRQAVAATIDRLGHHLSAVKL